MRLYVIRFEGAAHLSRAFDLVLAVPEIESCVVETEQQRLRFQAPESVAETLVERLYLHGGLSWCSRHALEQSAG